MSKYKLSDLVGFAVVRNSEPWQEFSKVQTKTSFAFKVALLSRMIAPHLQAFDEARQQDGCDLQQLLNKEVEVAGIEPIKLDELPAEMPLVVAEVLMPFVESNSESRNLDSQTT